VLGAGELVMLIMLGLQNWQRSFESVVSDLVVPFYFIFDKNEISRLY